MITSEINPVKEKLQMEKNDILSVIYSRRSVRKYKNVPVDRAAIETILEAGKMAPSAMNKQPWKFYVLTEREDISMFSKEIAKEAGKAFLKSGVKNVVKTVIGAIHFSQKLDFFRSPDPVFHEAPVVIFITAPKDDEWAQLDIGMCAQNILLAAKSIGLESCPVGFGKYVENAEHYSKLGINENEQVLLAVILGYGDETPVAHERISNTIFFINQKGND